MILHSAILLCLLTIGRANADIVSGKLQKRQIDPSAQASCRNFYADIYAETKSNVDLRSVIGRPPENQQALNELFLSTYAVGSTITQRISSAPHIEVKEAYSIYFEYCEPSGTTPKGIYQTHHGLVATADYWNVQVDDSVGVYSFAENAAANGWATLSYDRLGVGRSAHPDGTNIVQIPYEIEQSVGIARALREGTLGDLGRFDTIVGVGHSYGSGLVTGVTSISPTTFDAIILTGYSSNATDGPIGIIQFQPTISSLAYPERFSSNPNDYVITPTQTNDQLGFFHYPNYTREAIETFTRTKGEFTLGQRYTRGIPATLNRDNYTSPVLVFTGENDGIYCTANCYITSLPPPATQLDKTRELFPSVENFQTFVVNDTGHGINFHTTAREAYRKIFEFVDGLGL
ncbi:hypothetical protein I302_102187 [Kwoniella bestiolae CBS 10118]|uniref:AB hydrolase-1 domain-containing protein n=1 Tax=Kwoniella bestiolae CBS 10118 TaxID=1296100 RepID=A0A1B9GE78_9TREE|nr:hypothetical protein I302_00874 [Kwoniella bestiolae CBS 10118]OCF29372.1 hypothetical protein I302_00874 [Kwoniella bestiolae CBS 10118]